MEHHERLRPGVRQPQRPEPGARDGRGRGAAACRGDGYEIQMLHGMGEPIQRALVADGNRVRVYTPYGAMLPGMAYLVRRLLENTSNESFLKASFAGLAPGRRPAARPRGGRSHVGQERPPKPAPDPGRPSFPRSRTSRRPTSPATRPGADDRGAEPGPRGVRPDVQLSFGGLTHEDRRRHSTRPTRATSQQYVTVNRRRRRCIRFALPPP